MARQSPEDESGRWRRLKNKRVETSSPCVSEQSPGCAGQGSVGCEVAEDGVLPDNDSSCPPGLGLYLEAQLHAVLKRHDSMLMGGRPGARQGHPEDTLAWQVPRAPARGR